MTKSPVNIFWFRRDLRLTDNAGLYHALKSGVPVLPVFIFDRNILDKLENKKDARVQFIYDLVAELQKKLQGHHSGLEVYYGKPEEVFKELIEKHEIARVFTNEDYEPYARDRDASIEKILKKKSIEFRTFKDQVIFSQEEVMKDDGTPYTVFTPYSNKWKAKLKELQAFYFKSYPVEKYLKHLYKHPAKDIPSLKSMGFSESDVQFPSSKPDEELIKKYASHRDYPGMDATTHMGNSLALRQRFHSPARNGSR